MGIIPGAGSGQCPGTQEDLMPILTDLSLTERYCLGALTLREFQILVSFIGKDLP